MQISFAIPFVILFFSLAFLFHFGKMYTISDGVTPENGNSIKIRICISGTVLVLSIIGIFIF
jgi:hypothetical protein